MNHGVVPVSEREISDSVQDALHWFAEIIWVKCCGEGRIYAWPSYEKDIPSAHIAAQVAMVLYAWGEEKKSSIIQSTIQFIKNTSEKDKDNNGIYWFNPIRGFEPCPYTTALCINCLFNLDGYGEFVQEGLKWLEKTQLSEDPNRGGWPPTTTSNIAVVYATSVILWCLSDFPPDDKVVNRIVEPGLAFLQSDKVNLPSGAWRNCPRLEEAGDLTATTFALYALLKNKNNKNVDENFIIKATKYIKEECTELTCLKYPHWISKTGKYGTFDTQLTAYAIRSLLLCGESPHSEYMQNGMRWLIDTQKEKKRGWGNTEKDTKEGHCAAHQTVDVLHAMREYLSHINPHFKIKYDFEKDIMKMVRGNIKCRKGHQVEYIREDRIYCQECGDEIILEHMIKT